jgi:diguanylate cyclase (GGDEF)-like protein
LIRSVGLGNIAHDVLTDAEPSQALRRFRERAARWFEFDDETSEILIRRIAEGARQVAPLFELTTGAAADAERILANAKTQLEAIGKSEEQDATRESGLSSLVSDSDEFDALTGAWSAQAMNRQLEEHFTTAIEQRRSLSVLVASLDGAAELTECAGAEAGDAALVEMYLLLQEQIEPLGGQVARSGQWNFSAIVPGVDRAEALRISGEIRAAVASHSRAWRISGRPRKGFTASVGAASMGPGERTFTRSHQLTTSAVRAMEAAVERGGNCVRAFVPRQAA